MAAIRKVTLADWQALNALHGWAWFPQRSEAGWQWMFAAAGSEPGWVLEDEQGICGFLGNVVQGYTWGDTTLRAATGYSLIVAPRARGGSHALLQAFQRQPNVFATSIFNGNGRSAEIYPREGFQGFPPCWADAKIVWPLSPLTIAAERIAWRVTGGNRPGRELFNASAAQSAICLRNSSIRFLHPQEDRSALDRYWGELKATKRLVADRSSEALARRFADPDRTSDPVLLGWSDGDRLKATALAQLGKMSELEAPILDIIDLTWLEPTSPTAAVALISQLKEIAMERRASRLRLPLANSSLAAAALEVEGAVIRRRHVHAHVKLTDQIVARAWRPTPYDGDYGFALRPKPGRQATPLIRRPEAASGVRPKSRPWQPV